MAILFVGPLLIVLGIAGPALAHDPGTTVIEVTAIDSGAAIQIDLPIDELGAAIGDDIPTDALSLSQMRDSIVGYVEEHLVITSVDDDGASATLPLTVGTITVVQSDGRDYVRTKATVDGAGDEFGTFVLSSRLILENDATHQIVVTTIADDGSAGIAGVIDAGTDSLVVSLSDAADTSFTTIVLHGFEHVLEGADHLLFLLTLLLPAPVIAVRHRWESSPDRRRALIRVIHVATAFTVGHSVSLIATSVGIVSLPSGPVEMVIALSVAVSAVHALRPLTERGELPIAAGFGLGHGVAFAEILANYGLQGGSTVSTLLAFNLGVEAAQLATIALTFPSLWLLSRSGIYPIVRYGGAVIALVLAIAWFIERTGLASNPFTPVEDAAIANPLVLVGGLALAAIASLLWSIGTAVRRDEQTGGSVRSAVAKRRWGAGDEPGSSMIG